MNFIKIKESSFQEVLQDLGNKGEREQRVGFSRTLHNTVGSTVLRDWAKLTFNTVCCKLEHLQETKVQQASSSIGLERPKLYSLVNGFGRYKLKACHISIHMWLHRLCVCMCACVCACVCLPWQSCKCWTSEILNCCYADVLVLPMQACRYKSGGLTYLKTR